MRDGAFAKDISPTDKRETATKTQWPSEGTLESCTSLVDGSLTNYFYGFPGDKFHGLFKGFACHNCFPCLFCSYVNGSQLLLVNYITAHTSPSRFLFYKVGRRRRYQSLRFILS